MSDADYPTEHAECPICTSMYCSHPGCEDALKQRARIAELEQQLAERDQVTDEQCHRVIQVYMGELANRQSAEWLQSEYARIRAALQEDKQE